MTHSYEALRRRPLTGTLRLFPRVLSLALITFLATNAFAETKTLKLGHALPGGDHPYQQGAEKFAELVAAKTGGRYKIQVFNSGQLGGERDMVEGLKIGTIDLVIAASSIAGAVANDRKVFLLDIPYIFDDYDAITRVVEGNIGKEMSKNWPKAGIRNMAYFIAGFHQMDNSKKAVMRPDDLKGLKIRAIPAKSSTLMIEALGPSAVPMPFPEVYTGISQGIVDGFANSMTTIYTAKYYEVAPYVSITNHLVGMLNLLMSENVYQTLSPADRKAFEDAALEAARFERNIYKEQDKKFLPLLKEKAKVNTNVDVAAFRKRVDGYLPKFVELVNEPGAKELADRLLKEGHKGK